MDMKFIIFGVGTRGKRLLKFLGSDRVEAFIDNNDFLWNTSYDDVPIINLTEYKEKYFDSLIIVTPIIDIGILNQLKNENITKILNLKDCPDSFYDYDYKLIMEHISKIMNYKDRGSKITLYGLNLFSLIIYDYLLSIGYNNIQIYINLEFSIDIAILNCLSSKYKISKYESSLQNDEMLFLTSPINAQEMKAISLNNEIKILYDFSDVLFNIGRNEKFQQFKGKHKNQRCFIVATGPSLKMEDLETLRINNELTISVNAIYKSFDKIRWRPDYYVTVDPRFENMMDLIDKMNVKYKFISDRLENFWKQEHSDNVIKMHVAFNERELMFSEDLTKCTYSGGNVIYNSLQLAVYMGFKEIYLLGVDFSVGKQKHFVKDYIDDGKGISQNLAWEKVFTNDEFLWSQERTFKAAKKYADLHGIKIYNATRGGYLEIFERMNFDNLFK